MSASAHRKRMQEAYEKDRRRKKAKRRQDRRDEKIHAFKAKELTSAALGLPHRSSAPDNGFDWESKA